MVLSTCERIRETTTINTVALSGGVWQNKLLLTKTQDLLKKSDFQIIIHQQVPPNDGGIALGQASIALVKSSQSAY
jgi:hydrogenase maturation protein HypF